MERPHFVQTTIISIWTELTVRAETLAIIKRNREVRSWTEMCAGHQSDLNKCLSYSSQTAYIPPVIAHVHPPGDVHRIIRGLPQLRALLPASCIHISQGSDIIVINYQHEEANPWRRQIFRNNAQKYLSVTIISDRLVNSPFCFTYSSTNCNCKF